MKPRIAVVAIGGNSLIRDNDHQTIQDQYAAAQETCIHIANLVQLGWHVAITHGNGPQVGFCLRRSELAAEEVPESPLHICGAETQGSIGYMLQQILYGEFHKRGLLQDIVTLVTQVIVSQDDSAFSDPTKPIGSYMDEKTAQQREAEGWQVREVERGRWRRVVPSPKPLRIVEEPVITNLLRAGVVVITAGGGGIPVVEDEEGCLEGVAAVIDKDRVSALLGNTLGARLLLISTKVDKVYINYGEPGQKAIETMSISTARRYLKEGHFKAGSMKPKIESAITFLENGGKQAIITSPENLTEALIRNAGTRILPD